MRRQHELFYCELCVDNLEVCFPVPAVRHLKSRDFFKLFPCERRVYDRRALAEHRRMGDPDDKSYDSEFMVLLISSFRRTTAQRGYDCRARVQMSA